MIREHKTIYTALIVLLACFVLTSISVLSQDEAEVDCALDFEAIMENVTTVCTEMGRNQVCYGNVEVDASFRPQAPLVAFGEPGDTVNLIDLSSLHLSAMDMRTERWGVAQMRLMTTLSSRVEEVSLILFGDVSVDNAVEPRVILNATNTNDFGVNIRNSPILNSLVIDVVGPGADVQVIGRLEDGTWLRVEDTETGRVGWVYAEMITVDESTQTTADLLVETGDTPYFGPMQAFYYTSGDSPGCGSLMSDGLVIQTTEGSARISLLINEVSIEFIGGGSAVVQANPTEGMTINVLTGTANVTVGGSTVSVGSNTQTTIPMNDSMSPVGTPTAPTDTPPGDPGDMSIVDDAAAAARNVLPIVPDAGSGSGGGGNAGGGGSGNSGNPPGQGGNPPGQGGNPPGQGGNPPGQGGNPPGQGGDPPGQSGDPPGQSGDPPGQGGVPPGQGGNPPGHGGNFDTAFWIV